MTELLEIILRLLVPRSFIGLKIRLFSLLIVGVIADLGLKISISTSKASSIPIFGFEIPGSSLATVIICSILVVFLVLVDMIIIQRKQRFRERMFTLLTDPNVDESTKAFLIDSLGWENRERF